MPNPVIEPILSYFHLSLSSQTILLKFISMLLSHIFFGLPEWVFTQQHSICLPCFPHHSHLTTLSQSPSFHYMKSTKWAVTIEIWSVTSTVVRVLQPCLSFTFSLHFWTVFVQTHTQYIFPQNKETYPYTANYKINISYILIASTLWQTFPVEQWQVISDYCHIFLNGLFYNLVVILIVRHVHTYIFICICYYTSLFNSLLETAEYIVYKVMNKSLLVSHFVQLQDVILYLEEEVLFASNFSI